MDVQTRCDISRTVKIEVKLLLCANRKSYVQYAASIGTTMDDLEWPFYGSVSLAIFAVAELFVN